MSTIRTLKYRRYAAKSPQDPDGAAKWYARAVQDRTWNSKKSVVRMGFRRKLAI